MNPLTRLHEWLLSHRGGRLIISADSFELDARDLDGLPQDDDRFASREGDGVFSLEMLDEVIDEMDEWEAAGWEYED